MHPVDIERPNEPYNVYLAKTMTFRRIKLESESSK
jgi:hypothetical protein